jgi:hypothetical protein
MRHIGRRFTRWGVLTFVVALVLGLVAAAPAAAQVSTALDRPVWLCLPGMAANPCGQDLAGDPRTAPFTAGYPVSRGRVPLDTTRVDPGGTTAVEPLPSPSAPPIDCFYVYPTVDLLPNPLLQVGSVPPVVSDTEAAVMFAQVGPLLSQCRMFVPVYRQASLAAHVVGVLTGTSPEYALGLGDVEQAWDTYWNEYNTDPVTHRRRGVVVLGHSQGAADASALIRDRIDGDPVAGPQLVSALLLGGNVPVPIDRPAGGGADPDAAFQHVPVCQRSSAAQPVPIGCVAGYSAYQQPEGVTLPPGSAFGLSAKPGHRVLCTNPATLLTGAPAGAETPLDARLPTPWLLEGTVLVPNGHLSVVLLGVDLPRYPTGYARFPGALTGQCVFREQDGGSASWLQVKGNPALIGEPASGGLGLHVRDFTLALGDLSALVAAQSTRWRLTH